ncbi:ATP phosphoribosyltransferase regulatory subunit [Chitinimonas sp. DQS-5]|uniref:ATP phosphoribosyltransferase regulatory subunit n=2 Tax=Parachitinimonas caeni TaxID=3031301 RepID=A0ABT7DW31_9NEIS|nr:ATP phosphoribosyltransferase regulatory subunit [Parachitinimonas caeni]
MQHWILPENISDVLPPEARRIEFLRRKLLDCCSRFGYELVMPPLLEYVESLFTLEDAALDLKTFKLTDQLSGRQMGLRADITPQVARIDAHLLNRHGVTRLCYAGSIVNTRPDGILSSREPLQVGAELYGHDGLTADVEIIELMHSCLKLAGVESIHLDVGHIGLFLALADEAELSGDLRQAIFNAMQKKNLPELATLTAHLPETIRKGITSLPQLYGGVGVLHDAARLLPDFPQIRSALSDLQLLSEALQLLGIEVFFDLAELRSGYYHTGLVFAAYAPGWSNAIARGGRYDRVGEKFGRPRPATGFSVDLKELAWKLPPPPARPAILSPDCIDPALIELTRSLRASGETVVVKLGDVMDVDELKADREIRQVADKWIVVPIDV